MKVTLYLYCALFIWLLAKTTRQDCLYSDERNVTFRDFGSFETSKLTCYKLSETFNKASTLYECNCYHYGNLGRCEDCNYNSNLRMEHNFKVYGVNLLTAPKHINSIPAEMKYILQFRVEHTELEEIFPSVTEICSRLEELYLGYNNIKEFKKDVLQPLQYLKILDISHNLISSIEENTFAGNAMLSKLLLNNNRIHMLPQGLFQSLGDLEIVDVSWNPIFNLADSTFSRQLNLESLGVSNLSLSDEFIITTLRSNKNLQVLDISHNNLTKIDTVSLTFLSSLRVLNLSCNHINKLDEHGFYNFEITELVLSQNQISAIPDTLFLHLKRLSKLDMSNNPIEKISFLSFRDLPELKFLDMANTNLNDSDVINLVNKSLQYKNISMSNNYITNIASELFSNISSLTYLDISSNLIETIEKQAFLGLYNLTFLLLHNNAISSLSSILFKDTIFLEYLDLSSNRLSTLPAGIFSSCTNLKILNLSFNELESLNKLTLYSLKNLTELLVQNNNLSKIEGARYLHSLKLVSLEKNPWECQSLLEFFNDVEETTSTELQVISSTVNEEDPQHNIRHVSCFLPIRDANNVTNSIERNENIFSGAGLEAKLQENNVLLKNLNTNLKDVIKEFQSFVKFSAENKTVDRRKELLDTLDTNFKNLLSELRSLHGNKNIFIDTKNTSISDASGVKIVLKELQSLQNYYAEHHPGTSETEVVTNLKEISKGLKNILTTIQKFENSSQVYFRLPDTKMNSTITGNDKSFFQTSSDKKYLQLYSNITKLVSKKLDNGTNIVGYINLSLIMVLTLSVVSLLYLLIFKKKHANQKNDLLLETRM